MYQCNWLLYGCQSCYGRRPPAGTLVANHCSKQQQEKNMGFFMLCELQHHFLLTNLLHSCSLLYGKSWKLWFPSPYHLLERDCLSSVSLFTHGLVLGMFQFPEVYLMMNSSVSLCYREFIPKIPQQFSHTLNGAFGKEKEGEGYHNSILLFWLTTVMRTMLVNSEVLWKMLSSK